MNNALAGRMFSVFERSYIGVNEAQFRRDLAAKTHVILAYSETRELKGFSTLVLWRHKAERAYINVLFSGDTVIESTSWGAPALPFAFLEAAGALRGRNPFGPLYWLLTTKGHRTFRFLPLFFYDFYPNPEREASVSADIASSLGGTFFADRYDQKSGLLIANSKSGKLAAELAVVPRKDRERSDVRFFLERNPRFDRGDELLCLASLDPNNLRPLARRIFERGVRNNRPA